MVKRANRVVEDQGGTVRGGRQLRQERGNGYAGLFALTENPRHVGGGRSQQSDLILGRTILPADADHLHADIAAG